MSIMDIQPGKILSSGWNYFVDDYAITGGWTYNGEALIICDVAGGIYVFNGNSICYDFKLLIVLVLKLKLNLQS